MQRQPIPGESEISRWSIKEARGGVSHIVLTNMRVWYEWNHGSAGELISFPLRAVDGVSLRKESNPMLILLGLVLAAGVIGALAVDAAPVAVLSAVIGLVLIAAYFVTRAVRLHVTAGPRMITSAIRGGDAEHARVLQFLGLIESAALAAPGSAAPSVRVASAG